MYARHPDQGVREMAAQVIGKQAERPVDPGTAQGQGPARAPGGMHGHRTRTAPKAKYEPPQAERLTDEMAQLLIGMVNDPNESWWVVETR